MSEVCSFARTALFDVDLIGVFFLRFPVHFQVDLGAAQGTAAWTAAEQGGEIALILGGEGLENRRLAKGV